MPYIGVMEAQQTNEEPKMPCIYNPATGEVETLLERYQREAEIDERIEAKYRAEEAKRMEQAMKAVDEVSKQHNRTSMTYGICRK